jgi:hypothetical protein
MIDVNALRKGVTFEFETIEIQQRIAGPQID